MSGKVVFTLARRVQRVDGRVIYPDGATITRTIGDLSQQDSSVRSAIRAAMRAADATADGASFDPIAWDSWWDDIFVPAAIFTRFPAVDDPDIIHDPLAPWSVQVREDITRSGKSYPIVPLIAHLSQPVPGINLGAIEVLPTDSSSSGHFYAKGVAGGVASLDSTGKIPLSQIPDGIDSGVSSWDELEDKPAVIAAGSTAALARGQIDAAATDDSRFTDQRTPTDGSVTNAKVNASAAITLDKTVDAAGGGGRLALTTAERSKLSGVATGATANATDAQLRDRSTHTGTQDASTTLANLTEVVQDIVGAFIVSGTNTTVSYNDAANTFTINASTGTVTDPEIVRDVIGAATVAGSGIQITYDDAADTLTVASTAVLPTRTITAGAGLTGGGDLSANRTLSVQTATETQVGILEIATTAEATGGSADNVIITPAKLKSVTDAAGLTAGTIPLARMSSTLVSRVFQASNGTWPSRPSMPAGASVDWVGYSGLTDVPAALVTNTDCYIMRPA